MSLLCPDSLSCYSSRELSRRSTVSVDIGSELAAFDWNGWRARSDHATAETLRLSLEETRLPNKLYPLSQSKEPRQKPLYMLGSTVTTGRGDGRTSIICRRFAFEPAAKAQAT